MTFCTKCGANLPSQAQFCRRCGAQVYCLATMPIAAPVAARRVAPTIATPDFMPKAIVVVTQKSSGLAAVLSFFWCGLGQLYVGRIFLGIVMMFAYPALMWVGAANFLIGVLIAAGSAKPDDAAVGGGAALFGLVCLVAGLGLWMFGMVNAYRTAERFNREQLYAH